jgi:thiol-disulfide isomerase/thioredoxin
MKKIIFTILISLGLTLLQADSQANESFVLVNTEGNQIHVKATDQGLDFKEYRGKAVFLVLFGHMCPPCNAEIPEFIALSEEYKDKLAIIAIEAQRYSMEKLKAFKLRKGINYNLVPGKDNDDFIGHIAQRAKWSGAIPLLIALDSKGDVQVVQQGFIPKKTLEGLIEKLTK